MEIVITKVKVTKSIIHQMPEASIDVLKNCDVLGMVINVVKDSYQTMILAYNNEFYKMSMLYIKGETCVYRKIGKWTSQKKFSNKEDCSDFWEVYTKCVTIAKTKHLYI